MIGSAALASATSLRSSIDFGQRPMLVFWETTRACLLACRHCRASATTQAPPGELSTAEGYALIEQVAGFGRPYPILVLTGGDCLLRPDLFGLVDHAVSLGIPVCLSPSVTPLSAVTVTIGGQTATVNAAQAAPGSVPGLLQINVVVPATSTVGMAVPIDVNIGGIDSQANVTMAVK